MQQISREDINTLPIRRWEGEVCVVRSAAELDRASADIRGESVVGLDTETRPAFRKGESYLPCLVQVATARAVYLFQLARMDFAAPLAEVMASSVVKAGIALAYDLQQLKRVFPFEPRGVVDLGKLARAHGTRQTGLRNLAGLYLGFRIPKGNRTSNWAARELAPAQLMYAATDAWACRELYLHLQALPAPAPGTAAGASGAGSARAAPDPS